jgi:threonyl-tRNA synthetase
VAGLRVEVDSDNARMNAKIRNAQLQKIPYMLVVGDAEAEENAVAVRTRENENRGAMPLADFITHATTLIKTKAMEL